MSAAKKAVAILPCIVLLILSVTLVLEGNAQSLTNLFFLHHSTGNGLIEEGNMRDVISDYNSTHGTQFVFWDHGYNYQGLRNPEGESTGENYAVPNDNTDPDGLYYLFTSEESDAQYSRNLILQNHQVIAFKSCFPSSEIPDSDTLNQYKTWYLAMRAVFDQHTDKLFVVMSTPPLHRLATSATPAANARTFANWLSSSEYLDGHDNIVCFNLFGYLAGDDNFLNYNYEKSHIDSDSHPNTLANETVGPIFANFLISSAAAYTPGGSVPSAPANVSATDGTSATAITVTWTAVSDATSYQVWRHTSDDSSGSSCMTNITATTYEDTAVAVSVIYYYWVKAANSNGTSGFSASDSGYIASGSIYSQKFGESGYEPVSGDFDGDGKTDLAVYHETSGYWFVLLSTTGSISYQKFGEPGYSPVQGDFDGDAKADLAVYYETSGYWYILPSTTGSISYQKLGEPGYSPVSGDFDGDGKADLTVYQESSGYWFVLLSSNGTMAYQKLGEPGYSPVSGDFDGDSKADLTVYQEASGYWFVLLSSSGTMAYQKFGEPGYSPVQGDFDGDGKTDLAVYQESSGYWYILLSTTGSISYRKFGEQGYSPVSGDFDGDGQTDLAVYHEASGYWYILLSGSSSLSALKFGEIGYIPVQ